jgi:uncharacterized protein
MSVFVDTSAFLAVLDAGDRNHGYAARVWAQTVESGDTIVTSNYVVVETMALLQRRLDTQTVRRFHADIMPAAYVEWVEEAVHSVGVSAVLASGRRGPSIVDCVSFELMRRLDIPKAFSFDKHFADAGFSIL